MNDPPGMLQHLPLIRRAHQFSPLTKFGPIQSSLASSLARWSSSRLTSEFKSLFSVGGLIGCFNERRVQSIVEIWRHCLRIGANFKWKMRRDAVQFELPSTADEIRSEWIERLKFDGNSSRWFAMEAVESKRRINQKRIETIAMEYNQADELIELYWPLEWNTQTHTDTQTPIGKHSVKEWKDGIFDLTNVLECY